MRVVETKQEGKKGTTIKEAHPQVAAAAPSIETTTGDSPSESNRASSGTCFAVSPDGHLLTSNHIIEGAQNIFVTFQDGRRFSATVERRLTCSAPGFLDSGLTVFAPTLPRPARRGLVALGLGFDSRTSRASTEAVSERQ